MGGGGRPAYKVFNTTTNDKGEFIIPRAVKSLSIYIPVFFISEYGGIDIFAYNFDYEGKRLVLEKSINQNQVEIIMSIVKDDAAYMKNLDKAWEMFYSYRTGKNIVKSEKDYLINSHDHFSKTYPHSKLGEEYLFHLQSLLERLGDIQGAIEILREMIKKYPYGEYAEYAKYKLDGFVKKKEPSH
jgi:hypothetical protein